MSVDRFAGTFDMLRPPGPPSNRAVGPSFVAGRNRYVRIRRWWEGCLKIRQAPACLAEELGAYSARDRAAPGAARTYAESVEMESDLNGETHRDRFAIGAKRWL